MVREWGELVECQTASLVVCLLVCNHIDIAGCVEKAMKGREWGELVECQTASLVPPQRHDQRDSDHQSFHTI